MVAFVCEKTINESAPVRMVSLVSDVKLTNVIVEMEATAILRMECAFVQVILWVNIVKNSLRQAAKQSNVRMVECVRSTNTISRSTVNVRKNIRESFVKYR